MAGSVPSQEKDISTADLRRVYRAAGRAKGRLEEDLICSGFHKIVDAAATDYGQHANMGPSIDARRCLSTRLVNPDRSSEIALMLYCASSVR